MTFGEKLVYLRERRGMSQEELVEKLDVSRQTISNWENDKVKIDVDKAIEICQIFDVDLNSLFLTPNTDQLEQNKSTKNVRERSPSKNLILLTVIACVVLVISVVLLILFAILLSHTQSNGNSFGLAGMPTPQNDNLLVLLICSLIITIFSILTLILCVTKLIVSSRKRHK